MCQAWFYSPSVSDDRIVLPANEAHHALRSRRLSSGAQVAVFDGHGQLARGILRLDPIDRRRPAQPWIDVRHRETHPPPSCTLTLIVAIPRPSRLDWMIEKCTELGVHTIMLCPFARSTARPAAARPERLRRIAIEACKQARRVWLPELQHAPDPLTAVSRTGPAVRLVAHPTPGAPRLPQALPPSSAAASLAVVIGPEGGLTPDELDALRDAGARPVRLAPHILRVETAAVAVAAQWQALTAGSS